MNVFVFLIAGMLITGTINTVITKLIFDTNEAVGCCGYSSSGIPNEVSHGFSHPWFSTWVMFLGELMTFIPFIITRRMDNKKLVKADRENPYHYIFAIPTCCDLTASTLGNIALLWIPASIWQMMRGAIIIFGAILSFFVLKKKLRLHHWIGITCVVFGLFLVGLSGFLTESAKNKEGTNRRDPVLFAAGIILVVFAQLIAASQMIIEEILLKNRSYEPMNVVFMEGFWGVTIMSCIALPILYITPHAIPASPPYTWAEESAVLQVYNENTPDALSQMINNPIFLLENLILLFSISFFNFFGLSLTRYLSTVHRTLIDACRTISVWLIQVIFWYIGLKSVGEELTINSIYQAFGFVLLVIGTIIYNEVVKIPGSVYEVIPTSSKEVDPINPKNVDPTSPKTKLPLSPNIKKS